MTAKAGYRSIDEIRAGKKRFGKRMLNRLRLKNFFGRKEDDDRGSIKSISTESRTEATVNESPLQGEEGDFYNDKFDIYISSSFLPHVSIDEKDDIDLLAENPSLHWKAFSKAKRMAIPPYPPQKARTRKQNLAAQYPLSRAEIRSSLEPRSLAKMFQSESETNSLPNSITHTKQGPTTPPIKVHPQAKYNTKEFLSFGDDLIDTVVQSQSDFNAMLEKMSLEADCLHQKNPVSEDSVTLSSPKTEIEIATATKCDSKRKTTAIPKTMRDIKSYLSQLKAGAGPVSNNTVSHDKSLCTAGAVNYTNILRSRMTSMAKSLSSVGPDMTPETSDQSTELPSTCHGNMCLVMEWAEILSNSRRDQVYEEPPSPLEHTWLDVNDDSDSVSKLTVPFPNDMSQSMFSDRTSVASAVEPLRQQ
mmetsp:Transcript_69086/g.140477  ORF Transcript_69086/g.140477 Transcript_69086/m.140477 type:complete len:417 (-) Transcript_69086:256-1506(-)